MYAIRGVLFEISADQDAIDSVSKRSPELDVLLHQW